MSDKPFDPFRYSTDTVPELVRRDLLRMPVPELPAADLEPPATLKQRLGLGASDAPTLLSAGSRRHREPVRYRLLASVLVLVVLCSLGGIALTLFGK
jgi:hypothetical protein